MKLIETTNMKEFDEFVKVHPNANIMQSSSWAQVKQEDWKPHYLMFEDEGEIIGTALLLERTAFLNKALFYAPRGPILNYEDEVETKKALDLLKQYVKDHNGFVLRFDPELILNRTDLRADVLLENNIEKFEMLNKLSKHKGFNLDMGSTFQPRYQMVIDLKEDLFDKLRSKHKRLFKEEYINQRGFKFIEDTSVEGVKEFARLSALTEERQNVFLRNEEYFMKIYHSFIDKGEVKIFFIELNVDELIEYHKDDEVRVKELEEIKRNEGNIIRTNGILCVYGTSMVQMFYAGNDVRFSRYRVVYYLIYNASRLAREDNYLTFNLGGVSGTLDDGLFDFKSKFHPELYEYMGDFDIVVNKMVYLAFEKGLKVYKKIRR